MLQIMEKNGLITRGSVPYDSRLKKITPTEKALELHRQISSEIDAIEAELSAGLSEEEIASFIATIEKIKKNLQK